MRHNKKLNRKYLIIMAIAHDNKRNHIQNWKFEICNQKLLCFFFKYHTFERSF